MYNLLIANRIFLSVLFLFLCTTKHSMSQTYAVGHRTISFIDVSRSNRAVATELYYPADAAGANVPLAFGNSSFPVIVFGHGFVIPISSYKWLSDSLVKYGYIVVLANTEGSFNPNHANFGTDLSFLCNRVTSLNDSSSSFLFNRVIKKSAVAGHSMGGGASFLAAAANNSITALFNFAAAETNPSAKVAALLVQKPSLIFSGSADCIVPDTNQLAMYSNIPYPCKSYVNINDALHCHFANNDATCSFGQLTSGCNSSSTTADAVNKKVFDLLLPFLDYYLKSNCVRRLDFEQQLFNANGFIYQNKCLSDPIGCAPLSISSSINSLGFNNQMNGQNEFSNVIRIMPNPAAAYSNLTIYSGAKKIKRIVLWDVLGNELYENHQLENTTVIIPASNYKGLGYIFIESTRSERVIKKIIFL